MTKKNSHLFAISDYYGMYGSVTWYVNVLEPDFQNAQIKLINFFKESKKLEMIREVRGEERQIILEQKKCKTI
jgi:hypothetical protein